MINNKNMNKTIYKLMGWFFENIYCSHSDTIDVGDEDHIAVACTHCSRMLPANNWFISLREKSVVFDYFLTGEPI